MKTEEERWEPTEKPDMADLEEDAHEADAEVLFQGKRYVNRTTGERYWECVMIPNAGRDGYSEANPPQWFKLVQ